jgi:hypothetical protein
MQTLNIEPKFFTAGDSVEWERYLEGYPPSEGWGLFYSFRNFESSFNLAALPKADHYRVTLSAKETLQYKAGIYWWQATVFKAEDQQTVLEGTLEVKPNLALLDSYDGRSHVKKTLDALEATILGKASRDQLSYSIAGRSLSRLNPTELLKWRDVYRAELVREINRERLSKGLKSGGIIKVRFGNS